jgi:hypothetical protein
MGRREREQLEGEGNYEDFVFLIKCCWAYDVKEDEMGWVCSTYWTDWGVTKNWIWYINEKHNFFTATPWQKIEKCSRLGLLLL